MKLWLLTLLTSVLIGAAWQSGLLGPLWVTTLSWLIDHATFVAIATSAAAMLSIALFARSRHKAGIANRERNEALHLFAMNTVASTTPPINPPSADVAHQNASDTSPVKRGRTEGQHMEGTQNQTHAAPFPSRRKAKNKPSGQAPPVGGLHVASHAESTLEQDYDSRPHFQPVVRTSLGTVSGYLVYRSAMNRKTGRREHVQYMHAPGKQLRARFEYNTLMAAASETRRALITRGPSGENDCIVDIPVSRALLCDDLLADEILSLFRAHPGLCSNVRLCVDSASLRGNSEKLNRRVQALQIAGVCLSLNIVSAGLSAIEDHHLRWFDAAFVDKADVQNAAMQDEARDFTSGATSKSRPDLISLINALQEMGVPIIARNVVVDADAVDMLAEGIDHMCGSHFCEPRALDLRATGAAVDADCKKLNFAV